MQLRESSNLVCPLTRLPLREVDLSEARDAINAGRPLAVRSHGKSPVGETARVMLRSDAAAAYPVVDDIPVLLAPEVLAATPPSFDLVTSHYAEAYLETAFYDAEASAKALAIRDESLSSSSSEVIRWLGELCNHPKESLRRFPKPKDTWLSDRMDLGANWDCLDHIGTVEGRRVLQVGGTGASAIAFLLGSAAEAWLLTPMIGEARLALALADATGVQLRCVVGIGEELPFRDASFDVVYSAGCVHHMTTSLAMPEMARVLGKGGRFAAIEPWRAPLYGWGTRVFGKREANAFCRPLTAARVAPLFTSFSSARAVHHGALARYAMLALEKFGVRFPKGIAWRVGQLDDALSTFLHLRSFGSSVALLGAIPE